MTTEVEIPWGNARQKWFQATERFTFLPSEHQRHLAKVQNLKDWNFSQGLSRNRVTPGSTWQPTSPCVRSAWVGSGGCGRLGGTGRHGIVTA